jgi:hypothetical protein
MSKYRIYINDIAKVVASWKKKAGQPGLNPCADIDHKSETMSKYRVYINDMKKITDNWKKKDSQLPDSCPRPE